MKKFLILLITVVLLTSLSACVVYVHDKIPAVSGKDQKQNENDLKVDRDRALEIALEKADVHKDDIRDLEIELNRERGITAWEINFDYNGTEYSYDVNADTGIIEKIEKEKDLF